MTINTPTIAVLLTCHNRREKTLQCLQALFEQQGLNDGFVIDVFLVDDRSTDGTAEAIRNHFPKVNIIQGNGNLYWNRGMHLAWKTAATHKDFDYYLWLNDDTYIYQDSLRLSIRALKKTNNTSIICGATRFAENCTYSAYKQIKGIHFNKLIPNGELQSCQVFNGNFVLIPKFVFKTVGNLDYFFVHSIGDFDYGLRANKMNISIFLLPEYIGTCDIELNRENKIWEKRGLNISNRIKLLYSPLGNNPIRFFVYQFRHFGIIEAIKTFIAVHIKLLLLQK